MSQHRHKSKGESLPGNTAPAVQAPGQWQKYMRFAAQQSSPANLIGLKDLENFQHGFRVVVTANEQNVVENVVEKVIEKVVEKVSEKVSIVANNRLNINQIKILDLVKKIH